MKVILGFSGGLDTTYCAKYLSEEKGYEVHSIIVNTGGFSQSELDAIEAHAYKLGVKSHTTIDAVKDYYQRIIRYLVFGNVLKNNTYPLSVSAERLIQALHIAEHAGMRVLAAKRHDCVAKYFQQRVKIGSFARKLRVEAASNLT